MSLIPDFEAGVWNAWLFMIVFLLQWLAVLVVPKHIAERASHPRELKRTGSERILGNLTEGLWIVAILYSIFLPLDIGKPWFYIGLGFFIIGVIILVSATISVARAKQNEPFTSGIYRFSRHPMYLSMIIIYTAVSIAAASWLFFVITIATYFLQRQQMIREEKYCSDKFGRLYTDYMNRTPRWIGIPKSSRE